MKVMVTGASGFIGSYVVDNLNARGHQVLAFDRLGKFDWERGGVTRFLGDVRDATAVSEAVALSDGVIHCAGVLGTQETIDNPMPAVETNIHGSLNIFQACRQYKKRCTYVTVGNYWMQNTYSITKTTAENLAWMFNAEHGTEIAVVRALNAYGPRQKHAPVRKIMPNFVLPALAGESITVYGDGAQVMDMIYVADVADILVRALLVNHGHYLYRPERDADNDVKFEAGTGRVTTVRQIAEMVQRAAGFNDTPIRYVRMRPGEPEGSVVLGEPETLRDLYDGQLPNLVALEDGIARTVDWYRRTR